MITAVKKKLSQMRRRALAVSVTTMRPQSHAHLQMKVVNLPCLIFMALTKDCAAVIYWNNTAHKLNKLLLASVQRQLQNSTKCEASIFHFNC